jgi:hypothetical protein
MKRDLQSSAPPSAAGEAAQVTNLVSALQLELEGRRVVVVVLPGSCLCPGWTRCIAPAWLPASGLQQQQRVSTCR